jgi:integrase
VELGEDPQAARTERREKDKFSFAKVAAEFLAAKHDEVRPRTHVEQTRYLTGQYFQDLHTLAIDKIMRKHIAACLVAIKRDSGNVTAHTARAILSAFFTWCMKRGYLDSNPVIGTEDFETNKRDRVLSDDELAAVWNACSGNDAYSRIVRLLILTGCRRQEVGGMAWSELDGANWTIPSERSKNYHAHTLPLPAAAMDTVNAATTAIATGDHLFGRTGFQTWGIAKAALDAKLGNAVKDWMLRDLRRTVATGMANIGILPHVIEEVLNHQSGHKAGVAGIYNRSSYDRAKRAALAQWADHVQALATGTERKILQYPAIAS